jgi:hypothetical protein
MDNTRLINNFLKLTMGWGLCNKAIWRPIYQRALLLIGPELCMVVLLRFEHRLHCAIMIRIVQKHILAVSLHELIKRAIDIVLLIHGQF